MHVLIDKTTRQIMGYGLFTAPPADPNTLCVEIADTEAAKLTQAGVKVLGTNGQITVTPPPAPVPDPGVAKRAGAIAALKTTAGGGGPMAALAQAILDMHGVA